MTHLHVENDPNRNLGFGTNMCCQSFHLENFCKGFFQVSDLPKYLPSYFPTSEVGGKNRSGADQPHRESNPSAHAPAPHARHDRSMARSSFGILDGFGRNVLRSGPLRPFSNCLQFVFSRSRIGFFDKKLLPWNFPPRSQLV